MYLHSSRRQTSLLRYTRKGYAYIGVSQIPRGVMHQFSWRLFGCKPHQNLRYLILNPQSSAKQPFTSSFRHYNMDNNHYAIAKLQKVFGITSGKGKKFGLGQEKSPKTLLYQGWMGGLFIIILYKTYSASWFLFRFFGLKFR